MQFKVGRHRKPHCEIGAGRALLAAAIALPLALALGGCGDDEAAIPPTDHTVPVVYRPYAKSADIEYQRATEAAAGYASRFVGKDGFRIAESSWDVGCDENAEGWNCGVLREGCAGTVSVRNAKRKGKLREFGNVGCSRQALRRASRRDRQGS